MRVRRMRGIRGMKVMSVMTCFQPQGSKRAQNRFVRSRGLESCLMEVVGLKFQTALYHPSLPSGKHIRQSVNPQMHKTPLRKDPPSQIANAPLFS